MKKTAVLIIGVCVIVISFIWGYYFHYTEPIPTWVSYLHKTFWILLPIASWLIYFNDRKKLRAFHTHFSLLTAVLLTFTSIIFLFFVRL